MSTRVLWCGTRRVRLDRAPIPVTVDGLVYASSMLMWTRQRRKTPVPALAVALGLGIAATFAANMAHGLGHGPTVLRALGIAATFAANVAHGLGTAWPVRPGCMANGRTGGVGRSGERPANGSPSPLSNLVDNRPVQAQLTPVSQRPD